MLLIVRQILLVGSLENAINNMHTDNVTHYVKRQNTKKKCKEIFIWFATNETMTEVSLHDSRKFMLRQLKVTVKTYFDLKYIQEHGLKN